MIHSLPGTPGQIQRVEQPESASQVAELLAIAAGDRDPVRIVGGDGARMLGNLMRPVGWSLSTTRLSRIIDYQPTDMTLSVEAGARLADVGTTLAEHGQMLPIEAPSPETATIGGLLATALTGPRRYGGGTLRDVLIGISIAYPDGSVAKAGGMVVKNVSGFDMMRLHYGAMGTLGVIVSANFKVLPLPRSEFTVLARYATLSASANAAAALRAPALRPVALVVSRAGADWGLAARYEGRELGLAAVRQRLASELSGDISFLDGAASASHWRQLMAGRAMDRADEVRIRVAIAPASVLEAAQAVQDSADSGNRVTRFEIEPGLGTITLSIQLGDNANRGSLGSLMGLLGETHQGAAVSLLAAPDSLKAGLDVWGALPGTLDIMRRLKQEFDPTGILNPGCFVDSI